MKQLLSLLFILASAVISATAQIQIDSATVSLANTGTTVITGTNGNSSSGSLKAIGCMYISPNGTPAVTIKIKLDNITLTSYQIADGINMFVPALYAYSPTTVETNLFLPFKEAYTNGLYVAVDVTTAATGGQIACSSIHT